MEKEKGVYTRAVPSQYRSGSGETLKEGQEKGKLAKCHGKQVERVGRKKKIKNDARCENHSRHNEQKSRVNGTKGALIVGWINEHGEIPG